MITLEKDVERYLAEAAEKAGGKALKFVSPGHAGVPDRLVLLPLGVIFFAEVKAPGKRMRALQVKTAERIEALGFPVACVDSKQDVDAVLCFASGGKRRSLIFGYGWRSDADE